MNGSPIRCMFCSEPFRPRDGYVEFWRTSTGHHFCSEFCADDAEVKSSKVRSSLPSSVDAIREEAMNNHCAYCYGKFGLVRHRRGFKSFCSQKCADQHRVLAASGSPKA